MFIPIVILALFLGTVSVGAGVATVLNLTSNSEETVEPIVYTFDNADTVSKVATYWYSPFSYGDGYLNVQTNSTVDASALRENHLALQPTWPKLGDAFDVEDLPYLKIDYKLSGIPDNGQGPESFGLSLGIYYGEDSTASRTTITVDCDALQFKNGDELEIVVDMAKRNTTENAVWIRNISKNTDYVVSPVTSCSNTAYTGSIVKADLQLATVAGCHRSASVKYLGFFATKEEALEYPLAEEIAKLQANNTETIDGTHVTKGHAIEAAEKYIDSFGFSTNPEVKVGTFVKPTATSEGSYEFDVVFGRTSENQTTVTVEFTIEKTIEPIVYTFNNADMVSKIDSYGMMEYSFDENSLKMQALGTTPSSFAMKSTYPNLGDQFEVGDRRYLKIDYTLSGVPTDATTPTTFQVDLHIKHGDSNATSNVWFELNCTTFDFTNGDELEIIVDMSKRGEVITQSNGYQYCKVKDAVWVKNVTDKKDYIQVDSFSNTTDYTGDIKSIDFRLCDQGGKNRLAYVKYFGFFSNLDAAKLYPAKAPVSPLIEAYMLEEAVLDETKNLPWDSSVITKGHAIEAANEYIDSFGFTTNPVVKEGTFTAPTEEAEGSYVFDVVFGSGTDKEITIKVTKKIKKVFEPKVYIFDSEEMAKKPSYGFMTYSFEDSSLKMKTSGASAWHFALQATAEKLGDTFDIGDGRYLKVRYKLSGVPGTQFGVGLHILTSLDPEERHGIDFTIQCSDIQFVNGDEIEIVADLGVQNTTDIAVWVRNISKNQTEYVKIPCASFYNLDYTGEIKKVDLRLCKEGGTDREGYVKYFGFFNSLDEALYYPAKAPVSPLVEAYMLEDVNEIERDSSIKTKDLAIAEAQSYIDSLGFTTNPQIQEGTFTAPTSEAEGSYVFDVVFATEDSKTVTVTMKIAKVIEPIVYTLDNADIISRLDAHYYTVLSLENGYAKMRTRSGDDAYKNASGCALKPAWPKFGDVFDVEDRKYVKFDYKLSGLPEGQDQFDVALYIYHGDEGKSSSIEFNVSHTKHSFENGDELEIIADMSKRNTTEDAVWIRNITKGTEYVAAPLTYHNNTQYEGEIVSADFRLGIINGVDRTAYVQYFGFFNTLVEAKNYSGATVANQRLEVMEQELAELLGTLSIEWGDGNTEEKALNRATALIGEAGIGANLSITGYTAPTEDNEGSVRFSTTLVSGGQTANVEDLAIKINKVPEEIVWRFNTQELKDKLGLSKETIASIENHHLKLERESATGTNSFAFTIETPADAEQFYLQSYPYVVMKYKRHGVGPFQLTYSTDKYTDTTVTNTLFGLGPEEDQWYTSIVDTTVKDREAPLVWNFNHDDPSKNWNYRLPTMVALLKTDRFQGLTKELNFSFNTFSQANATVEIEYIAFFPTMEAALEYKNVNEIESLKSNAEVALKDYTGESIFYKDGDTEAIAEAKAKAIIESKLGTELMKKVSVEITDGQYDAPNGSYTFTATVTTQDGQTELYVKPNLTLTFINLNEFEAELNVITDITDAICYHSDALTEEGAEHTAKKMIAKQMTDLQMADVEIVDVSCVSLTPSTQDDEGNFTCNVTLGYGDINTTYTKTVQVMATVNKMPNKPIIIDFDDNSYFNKILSGTLEKDIVDGNLRTDSVDATKEDQYFYIDFTEDRFYLPDYPYFNMKLKRTIDTEDNMGNSQIYFWNTENAGSPSVSVDLGGVDMNGKWVSTVINMRDGSATLYDMETRSVNSTKAATGNLVGNGYDGLLTRLRITASRNITVHRQTDIEYIGFFPTIELVEEYMGGMLLDGYHSFNGEEYAVAKEPLSEAPRTIEAVVRIESQQVGTAMTILSNKKSAEDTDYLALEMTAEGKVKFIYGGKEVTTTEATIPTDEWVHIAAVVGDNEAKVYITPSNSSQTVKAAAISIKTSEGLLVAPVIGGDYTATNTFVGDVANVELYANAKADIVFSDYKLAVDPKAENVLACWPMSKLSVENTYEDIHGTNTLTLKDANGIAGHEFTGYDYVKTEQDLAGELKTFESWIKISESQLSGTYTLISNETKDSTNHFSIQLVDGEIQVEYNSGEEKILTTSGLKSQLELTAGKWTHVALTFGTTPKLYIDGTEFSTVSTQAVNTEVSKEEVYIGVCPEDIKETAANAKTPAKPENTFVGHMSDVRLWSEVLTVAEIDKELAVSGDLLSAWMLDEQTYLKYTDASQNDNTATLYSNGWYKLENLTYDYTIMHVADTQNLIGYGREDQYLEMMNWIAKNKTKLNTQFLFHVGDITQRNVLNEWATAKEGFDLLDAVKLPYTMVLGNHDYPTPSHGIGTEFRDETNFNETFPYEDYLENDNDVIDKGAFKEGDSTNVYKCFNVETENGTIEYMVFALEFGPRDEVLAWVSDVLEANPNKKAIITTHSYQDQTGRLATFDAQRYGGEFKDSNEGVDMWNKLVSKHSNIVMVNCGHAQGTSMKHLMKNNDAGKGVLQILADPSAMLDGGDFNTTTSYGIFMIMAFTDDGTMHTYYYSPIKNMYWDTANEYTYQMFTDNGAVCVQEKGVMK